MPVLVRLLVHLITSAQAAEYEVAGVADPFLQVALLKGLRVLGAQDAEASQLMHDVLAKVLGACAQARVTAARMTMASTRCSVRRTRPG